MTKQLEAAAREFESWRSKRERRTHTPQSLKVKAVSLRQHHCDAQIAKELGISKHALTRWAKDSDTNTAEAFIELPLAIPTMGAAQNTNKTLETQSTLNITLSSGAALTLSGSGHALADFVAQLSHRGAL